MSSAGLARADEATDAAVAKAEAAFAAEKLNSAQESLKEVQKLAAEKAAAVQAAKDFDARKKKENAEADGALGAAPRARETRRPALTRPLPMPSLATAAYAAALAKSKK